MKKQTITIAVAILLAMLSVASVQAQGTDMINVTIPFQFQIGGVSFSAGEYCLRRSIEGAKVVFQLNSKERRQKTYLPLTHSVNATDYQARSKLIFNKYDHEYFLAQVWFAGRSTGEEWRKTRQERVLKKEMAKHGNTPELIPVLARN